MIDLALIPLQKGKQIPVKGCNWRADDISHLQEQVTSDTNVGLVLGKKSGIVALDFDYDVNNLHKKILKIAGKSPIAKRGSKGFTMFYRWSGEKKQQFSENGEVILDVLGEGTYTVLPPSIHPKTQKPYEWITSQTLDDVSLTDLPFLPSDFNEQVNVLFGNTKTQSNLNKVEVNDELIKALTYIESDSYDDWIHVGMALKNSCGDTGFAVWDEWSSKSSSYEANSVQKKWDSFEGDGLSVGSIFKMAMDNGYQPDDTLYTIHKAKKKLKKWKEEGYPVGELTGIPEMNNKEEVIWHMRKKEFTVITGKPNSGKSEFLDYMVYNLAKKQDFKTFYCSFEKDPAKHIEGHYHRYTGKPIDLRSEEEDIDAEEFINEHFYFYNHAYRSNKIEDILKTIKSLTNKLDIDIIVIDPFSYLESDFGSAENDMNHVKRVCILLSKYAKMLNVHIFLVAHPKSYDDKKKWDKELKKYVPAPLSLYSISGGATFYNKCDNGIIVNRQGDATEIQFSKIREQEYDKVGNFFLDYDVKTRRYKPYCTEF